MRPRLPIPRERLLALLSRLGPSPPAALGEALQVPRSTLLRLLEEQRDALVQAGAARRRRYAARRALRGDTAGVPLYRVDPNGQAVGAGTLMLVQPQGCWWSPDSTLWPVPPSAADGWWDGLPYPLQDMLIQGYMGRQFARHHHDVLGLPADPRDWSDDDHLVALSRLGDDVPGDWILGDASLQRWLRHAPTQPALTTADCGPAYATLAEAAVATGVAGSSAAGEFPKFTARRALAGAATPHVIVKFSGADGSLAVRRWADLLHCEHLALQALSQLPGVSVARTRVLQHGGRTFLESERFDRHGERGRSPVVSLAALNAEVLGQGHSDWPRLAQALVALGWLDTADLGGVTRLHWFGRLIANTDMHNGNLSFIPRAGRLTLAPAYDMLPMRYAPLAGGEVPPLTPAELPLPRPDDRAAWQDAAQAAQRFWHAVATSPMLDDALRALGAQQAQQLSTLR